MTKIRTTKVTIKTIASIILNLLSNFLQSLQRDILKTINYIKKIFKNFKKNIQFVSKYPSFETAIYAKILKTNFKENSKWLYLQWDIPHPQQKMLS